MNTLTMPNECGLDEFTAGAAPEFHPQTCGEISLRPLSILLVDDEPSLREVIADCLREEGHTVGTAVDGVHGLEVFCAGTWDIVLVDRAMPRMSGFELAFAIKQRNPHMPVIMVSGLPCVPAGCEGTLSPVDVTIRKPFGVDHLREGMIRALQIHSAL
jgi:DNA-binding response OmpR family regulator